MSSGPSKKKAVEDERKKETDNCEEGQWTSNKKFRMVIKMLASERREEAKNTVYWELSKFTRTMDQRDSTMFKVERGHKLPVCNGITDQRAKGHAAEELQSKSR